MEASDLEQYGAEKSTVKIHGKIQPHWPSNLGAVYDKKKSNATTYFENIVLQMKGTDASVKLQNSKLGKIRIRAYASIKSNQVTTECAAVLQNRPPSNCGGYCKISFALPTKPQRCIYFFMWCSKDLVDESNVQEVTDFCSGWNLQSNQRFHQQISVKNRINCSWQVLVMQIYTNLKNK